MTVNMKDLYSSPGNETQESKYLLEFPIKKPSNLFTWFVFAFCVVIFPIRFDLSDFLYPSFPTTKKRTAPLIQQARTNQVNEVKCLLLKIPAIVYFLESITRIPIQTLHVYGYFGD